MYIQRWQLAWRAEVSRLMCGIAKSFCFSSYGYIYHVSFLLFFAGRDAFRFLGGTCRLQHVNAWWAFRTSSAVQKNVIGSYLTRYPTSKCLRRETSTLKLLRVRSRPALLSKFPLFDPPPRDPLILVGNPRRGACFIFERWVLCCATLYSTR